MRPDARIINLETAITRSDDYDRKRHQLPHERPENADCLSRCGHRLLCCSPTITSSIGTERSVADVCDTETFEDQGCRRRSKCLRGRGAGNTGPCQQGSGTCLFLRRCDERDSPQLAATKDTPGVNLLTRLSERPHYAPRNTSSASSNRAIWPLYHFIGDRIGAMKSRRATAVRPHTHRPGECVCRSWPFVASCEGHRKSTTSGSFSMVAAISSMIMKASADTKKYRGDLSLMYFADIEIDDRKISRRSKSSLLNQETSSLIAPQGRTLNGCSRCSTGMPAVQHRHRAQSRRPAHPFPGCPLHARIAHRPFSFDPGQGTPLVSALA